MARRCCKSFITSPKCSSGTLTSTRIIGSKRTVPAVSSIRSRPSAAAIRMATSVGSVSGTAVSRTTIRRPHSGHPFSPPLSALSRTDSVIMRATSASCSDSGNQLCSTVTPDCWPVGSAAIATVASSVCPAT